MSSSRTNICMLLISCCLHQVTSFAQNCDSNYFSYEYTASDFLTLSKAVVTPDNSVVCLQTNKFYEHGLIKFTPQGNVIYAYQYTAPFTANGYRSWTPLLFTDVCVASDSVHYLAGSVTKHGLFYDNTETPPARTAAVIAKTDKYGKVIWSRFFANATTDPLAFSNVIALRNGDVVGYLTTQVALPYYGRIICLSTDGTIKWSVILNTGEYSSGNLAPSNKRSLIQTKNGNIVVADVVYKYNTDLTAVGAYHFFSLNPSNGSVTWESSYAYPTNSFYIPDIVSAFELPNGDLSFQSMLIDLTSKPLNIITDSKGIIKKMIATYPLADPASLIDAKPDGSSGEQSLLMLSGGQKSILAKIDNNGNLVWSRKYGKSDAGVPPSCFEKIANGYDIFLSTFSQSFRML
ncbi:MAG TPA: hypothetical protein VEV83_15715, partial [Parafilimonas sp.]|nr:hypothetical protein [Parafilimonas sp.]